MITRIPSLILIVLLSFIISLIASCAGYLIFNYFPIPDFNLNFDDLPEFAAIISFIFTFMITLWLGTALIARKRQHHLNATNQRLTQEARERMLVEESKQKLEVALLQGQKLQAIGTLAGGIAHDFNNILYAIKGYAEILKEDVHEEPALRQNLANILAAAQRGQDLIGRILAFSRKQHRDFQRIDLNQTIEAALALLKPTIPASVQLQFHEALSYSPILGDQTQLHQVLVNLINNAVDAMDGEGNIYIELTQLTQHDEELKSLPERLPVSYARLSIRDEGHGMDQTTLERIFEPFFTTKEVGKGTGLGLSIAHSIISEHNGHIEVKSQLGTGTTFLIYLPLQP